MRPSFILPERWQGGHGRIFQERRFRVNMFLREDLFEKLLNLLREKLGRDPSKYRFLIRSGRILIP
jgi:hypothetical protein